MDTLWMLQGRYSHLPVIPAATVCLDHFPHLTPQKFLRKISDGQIKLPLIRIEGSQKSAKGVLSCDLANYIDEQRNAALREFEQLHG